MMEFVLVLSQSQNGMHPNFWIIHSWKWLVATDIWWHNIGKDDIDRKLMWRKHIVVIMGWTEQFDYCCKIVRLCIGWPGKELCQWMHHNKSADDLLIW